MLAPVKPLIKPNTEWLTVGDGRFGTDAHYIISNGANAHATDISDKLIKVGSELGYIQAYSAQNAESLDFRDEEFDFVLMKECFHHCPRPWIALHEAFRVCKKGVVLIEPNDPDPYLLPIKNILRLLKGKKTKNTDYWFEPVGNFGYTVNRKELEKFLLGMHHTSIAHTWINDFYFAGAEYTPVEGGTIKERFAAIQMKVFIAARDTLCKLRIISPELIACVLFKEPPSRQDQQELRHHGWSVKKLPKNPYLNFK